PFVAWQLAMALAAAGRIDEATAAAQAGDGRGPLDDLPASLSLPLGDTSHFEVGRGFSLGARRWSWPLKEGRLVLVADEPFRVELTWEPVDDACRDVPAPRALSGSRGEHPIRLEPSPCPARLGVVATPPIWGALR